MSRRLLRGTDVSILRAMCWLLFAPGRLREYADSDAQHWQQARGSRSRRNPLHFAVDEVRRGIVTSLILVLVATAVGFIVGAAVGRMSGPSGAPLADGLQVVGIGILLWATLGKQGWDIQTFDGRTVPEVLNRWVYRSLYVLGSIVLAAAVGWASV